MVPSSLGLTYICGNQFEIQNPNPDPAIVEYTVNEGPFRVTLNVAANGTRRFVTRTTGTGHLYYRGTVVKAKQNSGTSCPAPPS